MPFEVKLEQAARLFPQYTFVSRLTPSEQKAAFHVRDSSGNDLCLKLIKPGDEVRIHREITAMQALDHPNIVKLREYTFSSRPGTVQHYIIEEFIQGTDLSARLGRPWPRHEVADIFGSLCNGLAALRDAGLVHRDLKPSNIRLRSNGEPVIIDFGLVRHLGLPDVTQTAQGAAIGTPIYFAPEQFDGTKRDIDHRTDLFAIGILMYEALIGHHPFYTSPITYAELRNRTCESVTHLEIPEVKGLPRNWLLLLTRMLQRERARRPQGADVVAKMLAKLRSE